MARVESMPAGVVSQTVLRLLAAEVGPESPPPPFPRSPLPPSPSTAAAVHRAAAAS
jgi:hypothetical protein